MNFELRHINPKEYEGNLVLLYGNEVSDRSLPLSKKELDYLKAKRAENIETLVSFDRLPYRLYVVNFNTDESAQISQEKLRRSADKVVTMLKGAKQDTVAVVGEGVIVEEVVAFVEGMQFADYSFDRYKNKKPEHIAKVIIDSTFLTQEELDRNIQLWNRIVWCRDQVNMPVAELNAEKFAAELKKQAADLDVDCTVFDKKKIEDLSMVGCCQ